tara:strand:+ start:69324 stop:70547 length:1224 start_codon:yes stop_codon:yes gene_type:complete
MPAFNYSALDNKGREKRGVLEADSAKQVRQQLRARGMAPTDITEVTGKIKPGQSSSFMSSFGKRISINELALFTRQLATMLGSGIPLEESVQSVAEQAEKRNVKSVLTAVRSKILEGYTLAASMAEFPHIFSSLYCATVAAGEKTGRLDIVLERLAEFTERQQYIRQKIVQAAVYPAIIVVASLSIVGFLLAYVVPKMIAVFQQQGAMLPLMTRILIHISDFIKADGIYVFMGLIVFFIIWMQLLKRQHIRYGWHAVVLRLPIIGRSTKLINTARFSHTLSILTSAGVEVLEAMKVAAETTVNLPIKASLETAIRQVREGVAIHRALKETNYFPPMSIHLIASGENSGNLEPMLERTAKTQENAVESTISLSLSLFEPFVILIMGGVVLFIVLAILLPVFDLNQLVH